MLDDSRRQFVRSGMWAGAILINGGCLEATPDVPETEPNIEGPFYKAGAPERSDLKDKALTGTPLKLTGRVLNTTGKPLSGATLDIWHCDAEGVYDNTGFKLRGKLRTNRDGLYIIDTIVPKFYKTETGVRPAHIHFKVSAPGTPILTTQLYLANDPYLDKDKWVRKSLIISPASVRGGKAASFDFVLKPA